MAALLGEVIGVGVFGFVAVAGLSVTTAGTPAAPLFAKRAPTSGSPQLRQDPNGQFLYDRGFLFRRRVWFVGTCCPPVRIEVARHDQLSSAQRQQPVAVVQSGARV